MAWSALARTEIACQLHHEDRERVMKKPPFKHVMRPLESQVVYSIYAHRKLTRREIEDVVRNYDEVKFHRPAKGNIEIITMIGLKESGRRQ